MTNSNIHVRTTVDMPELAVAVNLRVNRQKYQQPISHTQLCSSTTRWVISYYAQSGRHLHGSGVRRK